MIIFDNETKKLDIPAGLGNLEIIVQEVASPATIEEIMGAISATTASTVAEAYRYTDRRSGETYDAATAYTNNAISGIVLSDYYTSAQTNNAIASAATNTYNAATAYTNNAISGIDMSNYYTSAQTDSAIASATASTYDAATAYTDNAISGIDMSNYYTSAQTDNAIASATASTYDAATAYTDNAISGMDMSKYYTSAQTDSAIASATASTYDAATAYTDTQSAATYNAATAYTDNAISGITGTTYTAGSGISISNENVISCTIDTSNFVGNLRNVNNLWIGTNNEYNQLTGHTANTIYFVTD